MAVPTKQVTLLVLCCLMVQLSAAPTELAGTDAGKSDSADGVKPAVKYVPVMVCDEKEATGAVSEQTKEVAADADSDKATLDQQSETEKKPADETQKETSNAVNGEAIQAVDGPVQHVPVAGDLKAEEEAADEPKKETADAAAVEETPKDSDAPVPADEPKDVPVAADALKEETPKDDGASVPVAEQTNPNEAPADSVKEVVPEEPKGEPADVPVKDEGNKDAPAVVEAQETSPVADEVTKEEAPVVQEEKKDVPVAADEQVPVAEEASPVDSAQKDETSDPAEEKKDVPVAEEQAKETVVPADDGKAEDSVPVAEDEKKADVPAVEEEKVEDISAVPVDDDKAKDPVPVAEEEKKADVPAVEEEKVDVPVVPADDDKAKDPVPVVEEEKKIDVTAVEEGKVEDVPVESVPAADEEKKTDDVPVKEDTKTDEGLVAEVEKAQDVPATEEQKKVEDVPSPEEDKKVDVPALEEEKKASDFPETEEEKKVDEVPAAEEVKKVEDVPAAEDVPAPEEEKKFEVPAADEDKKVENVPATEEDKKFDDVPAAEAVPATEGEKKVDVPTAQDVPATEEEKKVDVPATEEEKKVDVPAAQDVSAAEEEKKVDVQATEKEKKVENVPAAQDVPAAEEEKKAQDVPAPEEEKEVEDVPEAEDEKKVDVPAIEEKKPEVALIADEEKKVEDAPANEEKKAENVPAVADAEKVDDAPPASSAVNEAETIEANEAVKKDFNGYKVYRVTVPTEEAAAWILKLEDVPGIEFWADPKLILRRQRFFVTSAADIMVAPDVVTYIEQVFQQARLPFEVLIEDVQRAIEDENPAGLPSLDLINRNGHSLTWERYHEFEDIESYLKYLEETFPEFVTVTEFGRTTEGRPLKAIRLHQESGRADKKTILIDAGIHAREWITPATLTYMIKELVENPSKYNCIMDEFDWIFIPVLNPDGYTYTHKNNRMWRKTRSSPSNTLFRRTAEESLRADRLARFEEDPVLDDDILDKLKSSLNTKDGFSCTGTDANRNFGFKWLTGGSSRNPCSETFAGPAPFSEPETRAVSDFILKNKDNIAMYISLHAYSQMWLIPWGYTEEKPSDYQELYSLAKTGVNALQSVSGTSYIIGSIPDLLYIASGSSIDWAKGEAGIKYAFTLELRDAGRYGFLLPAKQIIPTGKETWAAMYATAQELARRIYPDATQCNAI